MKKYNLKITPLTEQDLTNIGDYIALELKNPSAALNTIKGIQQIITNLQFMPERYTLKFICWQMVGLGFTAHSK